MNRLAGWMMRLYPAQWRTRYGDELQALLADTGVDARVVGDLFRGGMRMQFSTWSFPNLALVLGLLGALLGIGGSFLMTPVYTSKATLEIVPMEGTDGLDTTQLNDRIRQIDSNVFSRTSLSAMILDPKLCLYQDEMKRRPLDDLIEDMRTDIRVEIVALPGGRGKRASAFNIVFSYADRWKAQATVQKLIQAFQFENTSMRSVAPGFTDGTLFVLDPASLPVHPVAANRWTWVMMAGAIGIILYSLRLLRRRSWLAGAGGVLLGLAGILATLVITQYLEHQYRSTAELLISGSDEQQLTGLTSEALSRTSLSMMINDPHLRLYKTELKTMPLEDVIQLMRQHLEIRRFARNEGLGVSFDYPDRFKAQMTVMALISRLNEIQRKKVPVLPTGKIAAPHGPTPVLTVLDPASLPVSPAKPSRSMMATSGFVSGLLIAGITALIRRRWKPENNAPVDAITG